MNKKLKILFSKEIKKFWYIVGVFVMLCTIGITGVFVGVKTGGVCKPGVHKKCTPQGLFLQNNNHTNCRIFVEKELKDVLKKDASDLVTYTVRHKAKGEITVVFPRTAEPRIKKVLHSTLARGVCENIIDLENSLTEYQALGYKKEESLNPQNHSYHTSVERINAPHTYVSFVYRHHGFTGGAHGFFFNETQVMQDDGELLLGISDFDKSFIKNTVQQKIVEAMKKNFDSDTFQSLWVEEFFEKEEKETKRVLENWYVNTLGKVVFLFDPYVLGPWSLGVVNIEI